MSAVTSGPGLAYGAARPWPSPLLLPQAGCPFSRLGACSPGSLQPHPVQLPGTTPLERTCALARGGARMRSRCPGGTERLGWGSLRAGGVLLHSPVPASPPTQKTSEPQSLRLQWPAADWGPAGLSRDGAREQGGVTCVARARRSHARPSSFLGAAVNVPCGSGPVPPWASASRPLQRMAFFSTCRPRAVSRASSQPRQQPRRMTSRSTPLCAWGDGGSERLSDLPRGRRLAPRGGSMEGPAGSRLSPEQMPAAAALLPLGGSGAKPHTMHAAHRRRPTVRPRRGHVGVPHKAPGLSVSRPERTCPSRAEPGRLRSPAVSAGLRSPL